MFTFNSLFERSNQKMLQHAVTKNMLLSFNESETKLHESMFENKTILFVNMDKIEKKIAEPGQPDIEYPEIYVSTNLDELKSYIHFDKEYFEELQQEEIDEMLYQFYNQYDPNINAEYTIDVPQEDGTIRELLVQSEAKSYTAEEKEKREKEEESGEACNSEDSKEKAEEQQESQKTAQEVHEETKKMSETEMEQNPKYATAKATWGENSTKKSAGVFKGGESTISDKHLKEIHEVEEILKHAIQGDNGGKSKSISPSKRLNMRAIITESSDNEYIAKHGIEGKDIKMNVIIDRSGSMHGRPTVESNILIAALNNLAFEYEELDVEVMFSETSNFFNFKLPVHSPDSNELWSYGSTGGSEGLSRTFNANFDRMKNANVNLVYTDGDICDEAEALF